MNGTCGMIVFERAQDIGVLTGNTRSEALCICAEVKLVPRTPLSPLRFCLRRLAKKLISGRYRVVRGILFTCRARNRAAGER